jgi:hypothetical protein|tara:strand:+ start:219 stop:545 length:327 start_codon:yes stop_codon:yes gene_type:complete
MNDGKFPYSIGPEDNPIQFHMPVVDQIIKYKDDEKFQKAPPVLPFELERINEVLGDTFVSLAELRTMLVSASNNEEISKAALSSTISKIDKINELILDIPEDLAKIGI